MGYANQYQELEKTERATSTQYRLWYVKKSLLCAPRLRGEETETEVPE